MLRWVFIVLVLINIIVAGLFYKDLVSLFASSEETNSSREIAVDVTTRKAIEPLQISDGGAVVRISTDIALCVEIQGFSQRSELVKMKDWLKKHGLFAREKTRVTVTGQVYRIYISGFDSRKQAEGGLGVLLNLHKILVGSVVYQYAPADWRISIQVFSEQKDAEEYVSLLERQIELQLSIETKTQGKQNAYLALTETTAEKFLQLYQSPEWQQRLQQDRLEVDQCLSN